MSLRSWGSFLLLLPIISFSLCSCASLTPPPTPEVSAPIPEIPPAPSIKPVPDEKPVKDNFSRTYSVDFMSFYPKLHSALQDYARRNQGNSFQVVRLGSKGVIFRGRYKGEGDQERFLTVITAKPVGRKKTLMEVKISPNNPEASSAYLEKVANALFQIFEKGINLSR
jgi:hypothetical protein